jgi:hypothetical protein
MIKYVSLDSEKARKTGCQTHIRYHLEPETAAPGPENGHQPAVSVTREKKARRISFVELAFRPPEFRSHRACLGGARDSALTPSPRALPAPAELASAERVILHWRCIVQNHPLHRPRSVWASSCQGCHRSFLAGIVNAMNPQRACVKLTGAMQSIPVPSLSVDRHDPSRRLFRRRTFIIGPILEAHREARRDARLGHRDAVEHVGGRHRPLVMRDDDEL